MVRQYRIDRFNGMEILVCEVFRKHLFTQSEHDALVKYNEEHLDAPLTDSDFRTIVNEELSKDGVDEFLGLRWPIPLYDATPELILRGPVVENHLVSLQVEYVPSVLPPQVLDEVNRFYGVLDSRHWRSTITNQLERYGSLFESADD